MTTVTDTEFQAAVRNFEYATERAATADHQQGWGHTDASRERAEQHWTNKREVARRTLLAMHAQAKQQGLRELQKQIIESSIKPENEFARGMQCADALVIQQIDAMLGGSHE